jgi:hypothetical protein
MGEFILWLFAFDFLITGNIKTVCKDMCSVLFLGLIIRMCCGFLRKYLTLSIVDNDDNATLAAKRKRVFLLLSFFMSGIAHYLLYRYWWYEILNYPDTNPYKLVFVSFLFGIFSAIYLVESLWGKIPVVWKR